MSAAPNNKYDNERNKYHFLLANELKQTKKLEDKKTIHFQNDENPQRWKSAHWARLKESKVIQIFCL